MTDVSPDWEKLTLQEDGVDYLKPCLDIILYWTGSVYERIDGILTFYKRSLPWIKKDVTFFRTESQSSSRRIKKDTFDLLPFWFQKTKARREIYMLYLESGAVADAPSDRGFCFHALEFEENPMGMVRLILPVSVVDDSTDAFVDLARKLGGTFDYAFGQGGYAFNWNDLGEFTTEAVAGMVPIGRRHPGIDLTYPAMSNYAAADGIKCVNWLTFLSPGQCERLGGVAKLTKALGSEIEVHRLPNGVMIQAGPRPELGDVNRRQNVPLYHRVGRVLAPIRSKTHPPFLGRGGEPSKEATEKWLSRFDS